MELSLCKKNAENVVNGRETKKYNVRLLLKTAVFVLIPQDTALNRLHVSSF